MDKGRVHFTYVSYPLSFSVPYYWYLGYDRLMGGVCSSFDIVLCKKMHGILQRQLIGILFEIIFVTFQDLALYRRIPKHITRKNLDLGVCADFL